jgi:UDP-3-O-[3-hydroxymyristoyl] N-acetylglucosamine deacetylase/3-hydroxyacyl-[acyl-carrier-protein] dehydratase
VLCQQRTIGRPVTVKGIGLHTGTESEMTFAPAPPNSGLVFVVKTPRGDLEIPARVEYAVESDAVTRHTVLVRDEFELHTVEHVLAALAGMGVTNCRLHLSGIEPPEPEFGSVLPFVDLLDEAGLVDQGLPATYYRVPQPLRYRDGSVEITAFPADRSLYTFHIQFDDPLIGEQVFTFKLNPKEFRQEIAPARTFVFKKDVPMLRAMGLAQGGTVQNAVVIDNGLLIGGQTLRFPDEFVRHKIVDLLGDLALLGMPIQGHITARRAGHAANIAFTRLLAKKERRQPRIYPPRSPVHWDIGSIMEIMPHRYPFLLVDRIVELEPGVRVVGYKNVSINEPFFAGHFPAHPIMPAVLIIEAMAQTGGVLLLSSVDDPEGKLVYFSGIDGARFRRPVLPGDQLRFELVLVKLRGPVCVMRGEAFVGDEKVAEGQLMSTIVER